MYWCFIAFMTERYLFLLLYFFVEENRSLLFPLQRAGLCSMREGILIMMSSPLRQQWLSSHSGTSWRCSCPCWLAWTPCLGTLGDLGPHLLHILQHHVAVPTEGFHMAPGLLVVVLLIFQNSFVYARSLTIPYKF